MKKLLISLILFTALLFVAGNVSAQKNTIVETLSTLTLNGTSTDTTEAYPIMHEGDWSLQFKSADAGSGDSANATIKIYYSNALTGDVWTEISSLRDTITEARKEELVSSTDIQSVRLRAILTGVSTDTCTVVPYLVIKKKDDE